MKETVKLGLTLLIIAGISGAILAFSNEITEPIIAEMEREESFGAFFEIFGDEAEDFIDLEEGVLEEIQEKDDSILEVYKAVDSSDSEIGYVFKVKSNGYGGDIVTAVGIKNEEGLAGIKVVQNAETPGIGTRIEDESFTDSFREKSVEADLSATDAPSTESEVQLLSGATVSTNAVLNGVNKTLEVYRETLEN